MTVELSLRPIDPFAPAFEGRYTDDVVTVVRRDALVAPNAGHFQIGRSGSQLVVEHALPDEQVHNDLTGLLRRELIEPGWVNGADRFERIFTGIVLTTRPDPEDAWELFYRNTLSKRHQFSAIHRQAAQLITGDSLLDLGCCFGFFPLQMRAQGVQVRVADVRPGTCELVARLSARLGLALPVLCCDAAAVPLPDDSVDTVTMLHLLEHVDEAHGRRMLEEALRLARRQVVVAVPLESEAEACFDHVRTLSLKDLRRLGAASSWDYDVHENEGGWLVLSRPRP